MPASSGVDLLTGEALGASRKPVDGSPDYYRIRWLLKESISKSIHVLKDGSDPNSETEPYRIEEDNYTHPISACFVSEPPRASITVCNDELDQWLPDWCSVHEDHCAPEPGEDGAEFDAEGRLQRCSCEAIRPGPGPRNLTILAEEGRFVTIGQFIEAVHPWLVQMDSDIRAAKGVHVNWPIADDVDMWIYPIAATPLRIRDADSWGADRTTRDFGILAGKALTRVQKMAAERTMQNLNISSTLR